MDIEKLTFEDFKDLPFVVEGESKEIRYAGNGEVVIRLKPTVYSFTHNRTGIIEGTDQLRLGSIEALLSVLEDAGLKHSYKAISAKWILSDLVLQPTITDSEPAFVPYDLSQQQISALPKAPPIEVVAKARHVGTPKHRYYNFDKYSTRAEAGINGGKIPIEGQYPETVIRFDWRNPMFSENRERLADEIMSEKMANWFIDVEKAKTTAMLAFDALSNFLKSKRLELWDICFFIAEDGETIFGEISPDCLRVRAADGSALDKDVWRSGGSSDTVKEKWASFVRVIKGDENV